MKNVKKLTLENADYPDVLTHIAQPPKQLYVTGDLGVLLDAPRVAIIGSRKVSAYGRQITQQFANELAQKGVVIVSGLALGVDAIAHTAALEAGGKCLAVLPTSLDSIYPATHRGLAERILKQGGALVTEYPSGTEAFPGNFVARNRIVSGLSDGVLITEAALKSGTLHTANFALDQGKTVFAVPGNITSQTSQGTNNLLKTGAILVTETADVLTGIHLTPQDIQKQLPLASNAEEQIILDLITDGVHTGAELLVQSQLDATTFNQTLTMLEITGKIKVSAGSWYIA